MRKILLISIGLLSLFTSCTKEEKLEPSGKTYGYSVPQGDSDFDARIVEYYNKYDRLLLLYDYSDLDAYQIGNVSLFAEAKPDGGYYNYGKSTLTPCYYYFYDKADKKYINEQLDLLQECFFDFYDVDKIKKYLPSKILLTSKLNVPKTTGSGENIKWVIDEFNALTLHDRTRNQISIAWANESVLTMTAAQKKKFMLDLNLTFLKDFLLNRKVADVSYDFAALTDYKALVGVSDVTVFYKSGMIQFSDRMKDKDWVSYLEAILNNPTEFLEEYAIDTDRTNKGILCKDRTNGQKPKDSTGKINQKYMIIINYFIDNFGVDIREFQKKKFD